MTNHRSVRAQLLDRVAGLLVGPLHEDEVIRPPPADTYLTGILWPEGQHLDEREDDQDDGATGSDDGEIDVGVPGYRAVRPCSLGLTFAASVDARIIVSTLNTSRYVPIEQEPVEGGRPVRHWRRLKLGYRVEISGTEPAIWRTNEFISSEGTSIVDPGLELHVRRRINGPLQVLTVTLINRSSEHDKGLRDERCLFQSGLEVKAVTPTGEGAIQPRPALPPHGSDADALSSALLYKDVLEYAVGHGIAATWAPPVAGRLTAVKTSWMPSATVKGMDPSGHPELIEFHRAYPSAFRAEWLAETSARSEITEALKRFADAYRRWIKDELEDAVDAVDTSLRPAADANLERCRTAASRIEQGVRILSEQDAAWQAFALANLAMDRQARFDAKADRKGPLIWRPFQLAYILLVIPSLVEPQHDDRTTVDLLWFPTGGGKTEAYLGLTAFQIFLRRLTTDTRRHRGGVDVLMRYTLRLLTVQQFQRAASLICACDSIRKERQDMGDAAISLGLYVGGDATPNRISDARDALQAEHDGQKPRSTPCQLLNCPVCGSELRPSNYTMRPDSSGIDIRCSNASCQTKGDALPIVTVDDFIYSAPTSLLIGTIDKFAQLPRRRDLRTIFGLDENAPPSLIIQDELHLISGPLGSMAGLYEAVVDLLCTCDGVKPKVIGSTATIGQASRQVRALFDRDVLQFPPSGFNASDSFFAYRDDDGADRLYVGLSSAGRSPKFALQAVAAALLQGAESLRQEGADPARLDPYWTAVLYFNSLRELGGAHALLQDDIPRQMTFLASRVGGARRVLEADPIELSSRVPSRGLPEYLGQLGVGLTQGAADPFGPQPRDAVLASNMISVGVDVPRLGLMLVNGQPKSTAEYIQASSRVGRGLDGLVLTLYNFGRPRDVSHFEHFPTYHGALYRSVEATSVTPWAPRARDKALHAVFASAVRHLAAGMHFDPDAKHFDPSAQIVQEILKELRERARSSSGHVEGDETSEDLDAIAREWAQRSRDARLSRQDLLYWEIKAPFGATRPHLMASAEEGGRPGRLAWPTPNSMREVEPSTAFALRSIRKS
ncbi:helicase-related protein [Rhizobium dioscoreae]|uniref:helicase-related protein n=1 Tax=Rhizobium TaxID=379 RepID=UPI0012612ABA|nr:MULTISPECIES: helicase-related protein [Rhizobium]